MPGFCLFLIAVLQSPLVAASPGQAKPDPQVIEDLRGREPWVVRYNKGLDALKNEKYDEAISLLRTSIAIDPTSQANRPVARGVTEHYFPHYYVAIAYLKSGQPAKAREFYNLRGPLPPKLAEEAKEFEQELIKAEQRR